MDEIKAGDICPHCNKGTIVFVKEDEPWTIDHLQCNRCDSTYIIGDCFE